MEASSAALRMRPGSVRKVVVDGIDADIGQDVLVQLDAVCRWDVEDVSVFDHDVLREVMLHDVFLHVEAAVVHGAVDHADDLRARAAAVARPAAGGGEGCVGVHVVDAEVHDAGLRNLAHDVDLARAVARDEQGEVRDPEVLGEAFHEDFLRLVECEAFHLHVADVGELDVAVDADGEAADAGAGEIRVATLAAGGKADGLHGDGVSAVEAVGRAGGLATERGGLEDITALDVGGLLAAFFLGLLSRLRREVDGRGLGCGLRCALRRGLYRVGCGLGGDRIGVLRGLCEGGSAQRASCHQRGGDETVEFFLHRYPLVFIFRWCSCCRFRAGFLIVYNSHSFYLNLEA